MVYRTPRASNDANDLIIEALLKLSMVTETKAEAPPLSPPPIFLELEESNGVD